MSNTTFALSVLILSLVSTTGHAACLTPPPASIRVQLLAGEPSMDRSLDVSGLSALMAESQRPALEGYHNVLGVTSTSIETGLQFQARSQSFNGYWCTYLHDALITVKSTTLIRIAADIRENSCIWNVTLEHEYKHVQVDYDIMADLSKAIERAVMQATSAPFTTAEMEEGQRAVEAAIGNALNATTMQFQEERRAKQGMIDTKAEYNRLPRLCGPDEVHALLARAAR